jgi:hypothetical protein
MKRAIASLAPLLLAWLTPGMALADGTDPEAAAELFRQGRAALLEKQYDVACPRLADSQRLDPKVGTLINLARCEEAIDRRASAMRHWDDAVKLAHATGDARESWVTQQRDALAPSVPRLSIHLAAGAPPDTRITLDGVALAQADMDAMMPVDAGTHVVVVGTSAAERRLELSVADEDVRAVTVDPRAPEPLVSQQSPKTAAQEARPPAQAPVVVEAPLSTGSTQRTIAYAAGGAAILAVGLGTAWGLQAIGARNDPRCTNGLCDPAGAEAQREGVDAGNRATAAFVVGGVLAATGVIIWLTAPRPAAATSAWVGPTAQPGGGGVRVGGTW